jgi:ubiquinone/menaquinone biosynthesis C-methylase UbiE
MNNTRDQLHLLCGLVGVPVPPAPQPAPLPTVELSQQPVVHEPAPPVLYQPTEGIACYCPCDFRNLPIEPGTVDAVVTDIPWAGTWLPNVAAFAEWCARVLKPGGVMATWYGQPHLAACMTELNKHLRYQWLFVAPFYGTVPTKPRIITSLYRPALVYSRGDKLRLHRAVQDWVLGCRREKTLHCHQQSLAPTQYLVEAFSKEGDLVVDPCSGGWTTAEACWHAARKFVGCDINANCLEIARKRFRLVLGSSIKKSERLTMAQERFTPLSPEDDS